MNKKIKGQENLSLTEKEREKVIKKAAKVFGKYLSTLGYDWENDPHMRDTPNRVTKAYVEEIFAGNFKPYPKVTSFEDEDKDLAYTGMVVQTNIAIKSMCSHHFLALPPAALQYSSKKFEIVFAFCMCI